MLNSALPLWAEAGLAAHGRAWEALDFAGRPVTGLPRRCRVQARQLYVLCEAGRRGWRRDDAAVARAFEALVQDHRRDDGLWRRSVDEAGRALDDAPDLYDQAFALFALAAAADRLPQAEPMAQVTLEAVNTRMAHAAGGWVEALPPVLPRRQNPHMHMLEATLAWQGQSNDPAFRAVVETCLNLMRARFRVDGWVREYFTQELEPCRERGDVVEPGHQLEWSWLLLTAGADVTEAAALARGAMAARRGRHGLLVREIDTQGRVIDGGERLWAQTEAVRALDGLGEVEAADQLLTRLLDTHLATEVPGLWFDCFDAEGLPTDDRVPASSLYHLMTMATAVLPEGEG